MQEVAGNGGKCLKIAMLMTMTMTMTIMIIRWPYDSSTVSCVNGYNENVCH